MFNIFRMGIQFSIFKEVIIKKVGKFWYQVDLTTNLNLFFDFLSLHWSFGSFDKKTRTTKTIAIDCIESP